MNFYLGIDFGTTGARLSVINPQLAVDFETQSLFQAPEASPDWPFIWKTTLFNLIQKIPQQLRSQINRIAINGTSATVLLCNHAGVPIDAPIFYHDG